MLETFSLWEGQFLLWIQNTLRTDVLNQILIAYTNIGEAGILWIVLGLVLLCMKKHRRAGFGVLAGLLTCLVLNEGILKNLVGRPRPFALLENLAILIEAPGSFSFPSGHSATSGAVAAVLWREDRKLFCFILPFTILMALSRLYVGVHYPTDVIFGFLSGLLYGGALQVGMMKVLAKWRQKQPKKANTK